MDLAARNLLEGRELVLLTDEKNAGLYLHDRYFSGVYTSGREVRAAFQGKAFDLVICDSYSPRVLLAKVRAAPGVDFVSIYGFLNGFEVHRTYFAFARMMEMLSLERIDDPIRPTISLPKACVTAPKADVCIAVGGEWAFRTYEHWLPVIEWVVHQGLSITLVGSRNGIEHARNIEKSIPSVRSTVGQLSLSEVIGEIANSTVFIGADGGLWHIACAIPRPTVVLFADCQIFDEGGNRVTRETADMVCETLYNDVEVSKISPHAVTEACQRIFARIGM